MSYERVGLISVVSGFYFGVAGISEYENKKIIFLK
jgi:hypothetical protein